eukprot:4932463-Pyramimonas_sp.AAC.1
MKSSSWPTEIPQEVEAETVWTNELKTWRCPGPTTRFSAIPPIGRQGLDRAARRGALGPLRISSNTTKLHPTAMPRPRNGETT